MPVMDIDTHFEPGRSWREEHPELAARLPECSAVPAASS